MLDLILFDIDGTLISARGAGSRALTKTIEAMWDVQADVEALRLDGKTDPLIVQEALDAVDAGGVFDGTFDQRFLTFYEGFLVEELQTIQHFKVLDGVVPLLEILKKRSDLLLGVATGNVAIGAQRKLEMARLDGYFSFGGFGSDASARADIIRRAMARGREAAGRRPLGQTVVIGDTPRDIQSGQEAGAQTIGVATGRYTVPELQSHSPTHALQSLRSTEEILRCLDGIGGGR